MKGLLDKINKLGRNVNVLSVWDIDDTLFESPNTFIYVISNKGQIVDKLSTSKFNSHRLNPGEKYDFSEFRDSEIFFHGASPISGNISKAKKVLESKNTMLLLLTARGDFNNKSLFLKKFKKYGLDLNTPESHVARSGNLGISNTAQAKKNVLEQCLNTKKFTEVHMYDDDSRNLEAFKSLQTTYPDIKFKAFLAEHNKLIYRR